MIKGTVTNFRKKQAYFSIETNGSKIYYYLPKKLQDIFINSLAEGETVSFNISDNTKIYNRTKMHQIISFISISYPYSPKLIYDSKNLQRSVFNLLINTKYFLIVDFEVSMARYKEKNYKGEIIQVGYMLVDHNGNEIKSSSMFLNSINLEIHNTRIFKLIKATKEEYLASAIDYHFFYDDLQEIMTKYHPKLVIWGSNDITSLHQSYTMHNKPPLTTTNDFINLLVLHRNYYGLSEDIGLYSAYSLYYYNTEIQDHDALNDAFHTKEVLFGFIGRLKEKLQNPDIN